MESKKSERLAQMRAVLSKDNFVSYCGMELVDFHEGYAKITMNIRKEHLNFFGTVHGGALFSLADTALGAAANAYGTLSVAIACNIQFMKAGTAGCLTAIAEETSINHSLATYLVHIYDDDEDEIATFQGMVYRKKQPLV